MSTSAMVGIGVGEPHVQPFPVPLPAERRNVDTDFEFLAAHMTVELAGAVRFSGETDLAGLETGQRPTPSQRDPHRAEQSLPTSTA